MEVIQKCQKIFMILKKKYNFFIIEDACHALGAEYKYKNKFLKLVHANMLIFLLFHFIH